MDTDPWDWHVADVQQFFRRDALRYILDRPSGQLPNVDSFLQKLLDSDVDGASLLDAVDGPALRDDFGITSMRVRGTILHCIRKLQVQSQAHRTQVGLRRPETPASLNYVPRLFSATETPTNALPTTETGEHVRSGEFEVQDAHGRKRRKLDISKAQPTTQEPSPNPTPDDNPEEAEDGHLPRAAISVDELFFGPSALGNEIGDLVPHGNVLVDDHDTEEDNFQHTGAQGKRPGEVEFVYRRMRHFLNKPDTIELRRRGRLATAILPYPESLQIKVRSAIVVQVGKDDEEYVATREQVSLLESGYEHKELQQESSGEWDFLLQKHKQGKEDEALPVYGESESGDTDNVTPVDDGPEASEDNEELLDGPRIAGAVEAYIEAHAAHWRENTLPRVEAKRAWTVWKKTKHIPALRDALIGSAQKAIEQLSTRLDKLKQDFTEREWSNDAAVTKSCGNLDATIEDREEWKWKISVWQRRKEPEHVMQNHKSTQHAKHTPANGGMPAPSFTVHPDDRMSVSPTPATRPGADEDGEVFHTPKGSPVPSPGADPEGFDASDEMSLDLNQSNPDAEMQDTEVQDTEMQDGFVVTSSPPHGSAAPDDGAESAKGEESSDDLPDLSTFMPKKIKHVQRPETPQMKRTPVVDLTGISSDSTGPASAQSKRSLKLSASAKKAAKYDFNSPPNDATVAQVDLWTYEELAGRTDRHRMLIKMLREAGPEVRHDLHARQAENRREFTESVRIAIDNRWKRLEVYSPEALDICASIAVAWYTCNPSHWVGTGEAPWAKLLNAKDQMKTFADLLVGIVKLKDTKLFNEAKCKGKAAARADPSSATLISSDAEPVASRTPHKKRKREVHASQAQVKTRTNAHQRQEHYLKVMESQAADTSQIAALDGADASVSEIAINPARDAEFGAIKIHPRIARKMKMHQVAGVRFLWREVTAVDAEDGAQGCLLAHTMGLGKTMQTIALLVAVAEASESEDRSIRDQLPAHLRTKSLRGKRQLRMLILCPPGLLQNWQKELQQWAPKRLRNVFVVESSTSGTKTKQMALIEDWYKVGGVLLIGYGMLRGFIDRTTVKKQELDGARLDKLLLEGPEIVVADEAHNLKNPKAKVSEVASKFKTETRIALTGTPMSNDVDEIYALVSWAAPGYLGDPSWFQANFAEPIKEGTYAESTAWEKRKSLIKLKVLHNDIAPKVDRADITALRGSLKSKTEYVITVPLTETQDTLYRKCIGALVGDGRNKNASQVTIFAWLGVLMLLTAHPLAFRRKLLTPKPVKKGKKADAVTRDGTPAESDTGSNAASAATSAALTEAEPTIDGQIVTRDPEDEDLFALGFTQETVDSIIDGFQDETDPQLSAKMPLFLNILELSSRCKDKVLVFSGSIPTINYVGELLKSRGVGFGRIDGQTPAPKRMQIIDDFHNDQFEVLVVSTRAGGVGLNIQGANRVVILDFSFNPTWEEQAIGRAYRLGQTKSVFVYRFVAGGTFETNIYNKQLFKTSLTQRVVDKKNPKRNAQRNTREYLYEPKEVHQERIIKWQGKDPDVLDKLIQRHEDGEDSLIRSIQTTETLEEDAQDEPLDEEEQKQVHEEIQLGRTKQRGRLAAAALPPLSTLAQAHVVAAAMANNGRTMAPPAATQGVSRPNGTAGSTQAAQAGPSTARVSVAPPATAPARRQSSTPSQMPAYRPLPPGQ